MQDGEIGCSMWWCVGRNLTLDWIDTKSVLGESSSPLSFADAFLPTACRREMIQVGRIIPFRTSRRSLAIQRNIGLILSAGTAREISRLRDGRDHNCAGESEQFKTRVRSRPPSAPSHPPSWAAPMCWFSNITGPSADLMGRTAWK